MLPIHNSADNVLFLRKAYFNPQCLEFIVCSFFYDTIVILFIYEKAYASK